MTLDAHTKRRLLNRLRRAQGQLAAVVRAVEDDRPCPDVATQLAATSKALDRAGVALVSNAMHECLAAPLGVGQDGMTRDEFEKLLMMFA